MTIETTETDVLGLRARGKRRSEINRRRLAEKALAAVPFVPELPFRVETFTGGAISNDGRKSWITDVHVVDARGRTVIRMPHKTGDGLSDRRARATWYAQEMSKLFRGARPCNVVGIDYSSKAIDLALIDENEDRAEWVHLELSGENAFQRTRGVHTAMPAASWYDEQGVYLIALERPFSTSRNDTVRLVEGAILASLPRRVEVWEVTQQQWKPRLGLKQRQKPSVADLLGRYPVLEMVGGGVWSQDALDAAAMGFWARDLNREIVEAALVSA